MTITSPNVFLVTNTLCNYVFIMIYLYFMQYPVQKSNFYVEFHLILAFLRVSAVISERDFRRFRDSRAYFFREFLSD